MNCIDYFATFEESLEIVRALMKEGMTIVVELELAESPVATTFPHVDDTAARILARATSFYVSGPFTRFDIAFFQLESGSAKGRYAIDAEAQGPLLKGPASRINLVDGQHPLLPGRFSYRDAYRNPETKAWEKASAEVKAAFKTIVSIVKARCPHFTCKPSVEIYIGPEARARLESKAVHIVENQIIPGGMS